MINQENIKEVLNKLSRKQLREYAEQDKDMVCIILNIFNAGWTVELKFATFTDEWDEYLENGNIACDRDDFESYLEYYEIKKWQERH